MNTFAVPLEVFISGEISLCVLLSNALILKRHPYESGNRVIQDHCTLFHACCVTNFKYKKNHKITIPDLKYFTRF